MDRERLMAARKAARKSRSGPTQPEDERKNGQVKLRLRPETAAQLRARAAAEEMTVSGYVARLVERDLAIV